MSNVNPIHEEHIVTWAAGGAGTKSSGVYIGGSTVCAVATVDAGTSLSKVQGEISEDGVTWIELIAPATLDCGNNVIGVPTRAQAKCLFAMGPWVRFSVTTGTASAGETMVVVTRPRTGI